MERTEARTATIFPAKAGARSLPKHPHTDPGSPKSKLGASPVDAKLKSVASAEAGGAGGGASPPAAAVKAKAGEAATCALASALAPANSNGASPPALNEKSPPPAALLKEKAMPLAPSQKKSTVLVPSLHARKCAVKVSLLVWRVRAFVDTDRPTNTTSRWCRHYRPTNTHRLPFSRHSGCTAVHGLPRGAPLSGSPVYLHFH